MLVMTTRDYLVILLPMYLLQYLKRLMKRQEKKMYELRQTWNEVFPKSRLFHLDTNIHEIDPAWPITSQPRIVSTSTIHVNPNKFKTQGLKPGGPLQPGISKIGSTSSMPPMSDGHGPPVPSSHDIEELKKLQTEKRVLEETRKKVEKMMKEKEKAAQPVPDAPSKMMEPAPNSLLQPNRRTFLQNYKIKKKSSPDDKMESPPLHPSANEKVPNIYIAPWKAKQILPGITPPPSTSSSSSTPAPSNDPRAAPIPPRDPRVSLVSEAPKDPRQGPQDGPKSTRDPRLSNVPPRDVATRDPRLKNTLGTGAPPGGGPSKSLPVPSSAPRLPLPEKKKAEKDKSKVEKDQSPKKKEKELLRTKESSHVKKEKKDKHKDKERDKSKERDKDKKKHIEKACKSPPDKEAKERKNKNATKEKEIKKEGKEKSVEKSIYPTPSSPKTGGRSSSKSSSSSFFTGAILGIGTSVPPVCGSSTKAKKDVPLAPASDKFKAKSTSENNVRTKRREHIRPRIESPVEEGKVEEPNRVSSADVEVDVQQKEHPGTTPNLATTAPNNGTKRLKSERLSDSDDSDHYDANKPQPTLYGVKKAKSDAVTTNVESAPAPPSNPFENSSTDTDLRKIRAQPDRMPIEIKESDKTIVPSNKEKSLDLSLFGNKDVDYRTLPPPASMFPPAPNPPLGLNTYVGKPDEDMRIQSDGRKAPPDGQENQNPRFAAILESDKGKFLNSPSREDPLMADRSKRFSFNSPHAAKWEKFREKNPEFKEYQRQASMSEKMEMEHSESFMADSESHRLRGKGFSRGARIGDRRRMHKDGERSDFDDPMRRDVSPPEGEPGEENYQYMINQLNEQLKRNEISRLEYGRCMEDIRFMMEKGKIRELQAKERGSFEGGWAPGVRQRDGKGTGSWGRQYPHDERFHGAKGEGQWREGGNSKAGPGWRGDRGSGSSRGYLGIRSGSVGPNQRLEDEWTGEPDLPSITEDVLRTVYRESETRTIDIDAKPREIRTYGEKAVVLMDWNDPRLLTFERIKCDVVFDGGQFVIPMSIGDRYQEFKIDGEKHRVKLGVPTQELMMDGKGYQCFFGGKPITVHLAGKNRTISLDGRPPKVNISPTKNLDYLLGKIDLIINARRIIPLYLDAKPQRFTIDGKPFVIKFIDGFNAVSLNGVKFPVVFGGLPISVSVRGYRQFLRFSKLPATVVPGQTTVKGMDSEGNTLIPVYPASPPPPAIEPPRGTPQFKPTTIPSQTPASTAVQPPLLNTLPPVGAPLNSFNPVPPYSSQTPMTLPMGVTPVGPPPHIAGIVPGSYLTTAGGVAPLPPVPHAMFMHPPMGHHTLPAQTSAPPPMGSAHNMPMAPAPTPAIAPTVDVQTLLDRLVRTGIIGGKEKSKKETSKKETQKDGKEENKKVKTKVEEEEEEEEEIDDLKDLPPIDVMFNLDNLRKRNDKMIKRMYRGMQCSSCGLRYPPEQTQQYSHHLDWHFRMNKKQQESTKKVNTRKFYLCFDDWIQYEEIEDIEERVPSMFEVEGQLNTKKKEEDVEDGEEEIPSIAVSTDPGLGVCPICHETFDQFYHQNTEEWHYKYAVQVDGLNYHPGCHQDVVKAQKQEEERIKKEAEEKLKQEEEDKLKQEQEKEKEKEEPMEEVKEEENKDIIEEPNEKDEELVELKVIEDEEIQEIEKEKDLIPKEEIDLTADDDKVDPEEDENPRIPTKEDKVEEIRKKMSLLSSDRPPLRLKEEQTDADGEMRVIVLPKMPPLLADIPIKMEIEDDVNTEPPAFDIEDDDITESESGEKNDESWIAPAPVIIAAQTDIASSIDGNTEFSRPETTQDSTTVPKIKISVSIPTQNNIEDQLSAAANNISKSMDNGENADDLLNNGEEFIPPPFTVDYNLKPTFRGVHLTQQPVAHRGMEISSLCSVM